MKLHLRVSFFGLMIVLFCQQAKSQTAPATKAVLFDGIIVGGYADHGAYINCAGPSVKFSKKPFVLMAGLLPGLRIKEDKVAPGATKNSKLTPSLGFGLTAAYKHLAFQIPLYYTAKTAAKNGKWNPGVGLGYKF